MEKIRVLLNNVVKSEPEFYTLWRDVEGERSVLA